MMLFDVTVTSAWAAVGWSVVHFLWQGAVIGLLAAGVLSGLRRHTARARYAAACLAMLAALATFVGTFLTLLPRTTASAFPSGVVGDIDLVETAVTASAPHSGGIAEFLAWAWVAGIVFLSMRFIRQWRIAYRLKTCQIFAPDARWTRLFESVKAELGAAPAVRMLRSGLAETPMVVGWLSPIVLVPTAALTSLTPDQLRVILIHELSHIRRYDHLANMVQGVIEIILFFHPVTWWLSGQIRVEREHCCDDTSVCTSGSPRTLAEALLHLESLRLTTTDVTSNTTLAASGGPLMRRITRLLPATPGMQASSSCWRIPAAIAVGSALTIAGITSATSRPHTIGISIGTKPLPESRERIADAPPTEAGEWWSASPPRYPAYLKRQSDLWTSYEQAMKLRREDGLITDDDAVRKLMRANDWLEKAPDNDWFERVPANDFFKKAPENNQFWRQVKVDPNAAADGLGGYLIKIGLAVDAGELSPEEAMDAIMTFKKSMGNETRSKPPVNDFYQTAPDRLRYRFDAGRFTEELNSQREPWPRKSRYGLGAVKEDGDTPTRLERQRYIDARDDYNAAALFKAAIESEDLTPEQIKEKLRWFEDQFKNDPNLPARFNAARQEYDRVRSETPWRDDMKLQINDESLARLEAAVKAGAMTKEQANELLRDAKLRTVKEAPTPRWASVYDRIVKDLQNAVEAGDLTKEQAAAVLDIYKQRLESSDK